MPKLIISMTIDMVPDWAVGDESSSWHRPDGEEALLGAVGRLSLMREEGIELRQLELDGGDRCVNLRPPHGERLVRRCNHLLQIGESLIADAFHGCHLIQKLGEGSLMTCEALLDHSVNLLCHFLDEQFDIGIHRVKLVLLAVCVVDGFQGGIGPRQLIPSVSSLLRLPTE
jgi:hypothetical protein